MTGNIDTQLITGMDVSDYFRDSVTTAATNQNLEINTETILYVVNMLTSFVRAENLYEKTDDGYMIRALALIYADSVEAVTTAERNRILQRLGDIALFISGLFSYSLNRSLVDVDYYAAIGGNAYANLADATRRGFQGRTVSMVFSELSDKFLSLVDVLAEVNENCSQKSDSDIMRLYELWLKTGSERAAKQLQKFGIQPVSISSRRH
ncbi:MAG TPA: hypothetical protein VLN56_05460 [Gammaproteobacteria bacterium]|nr:hypothetical protein [Gammaproteobacteria bacterium]